MIPPAGSSIYMWMYRQGLRQRPWQDVMADCLLEGHGIRQKDWRNYWNGWYRHDLYFSGKANMSEVMGSHPLRWEDYPVHPYLGQPENLECFVPCSKDNKPMVKWGKGCMTLADARAWPGSVYLAENMKGAQRIVIDVDGDHSLPVDVELLRFFDKWRELTCCHEKRTIVLDVDPGPWDLRTCCLPTSYHLTFAVDRVVPTMHFARAHVDVVGNRANSLRYFKDKVYNGLPAMQMDGETWDEIMDWIERRERG